MSLYMVRGTSSSAYCGCLGAAGRPGARADAATHLAELRAAVPVVEARLLGLPVIVGAGRARFDEPQRERAHGARHGLGAALGAERARRAGVVAPHLSRQGLVAARGAVGDDAVGAGRPRRAGLLARPRRVRAADGVVARRYECRPLLAARRRAVDAMPPLVRAIAAAVRIAAAARSSPARPRRHTLPARM